ncbi:MAG: M6 family metalloprotease domain-containing protein [Bacteroidetes bacterium]|nr:M6 family metalloprotease domain-containing protein [Bacteroidota bacterium]
MADEARAVTAYSKPVRFKQPDGSELTLILHGDEFIHWKTTVDGFTIMTNAQGIYEYASLDKKGDLGFSGIKANDPGIRSTSETAWLQNLKPNLFFSRDQVISMKKAFQNGQGGIQPTPLIGGFPHTGTRKLLMILANFSNTSTTYTQPDFNSMMNQANYNGTGSFKDYYFEVSYAQLTVNTTVTIWVTLPQTHDYYGPSARWGQFAYDAVVAADQQAGVDYSQFDNDADGIVDGITIIHQGRGQEESGDITDIWSHSSDLAAAGYTVAQRTFDGVEVSSYTANPEKFGTTNMTAIGVLCHEFCHNLGAPDFYDTDYGTNGQYDGTGYWDLMASGSWNGMNGNTPAHPNGWIKNYFSWTNPVVLATQQTQVLRNVQLYPDVVRYNTTTSNEYFLCENRQQTGFDAGIPGHGMIIYHVDGAYVTSHFSSNNINTSSHQGLYPMSANSNTANGIMPGSSSNINTPGCPWPGTGGKTNFTDVTIPCSKSWAGANTNLPLISITENLTTKEVSFCFITCATCPGIPTITVNHLVSGGVAPVDKTVTYNTATSIPGEPLKCWITSNLGADHQATAVNDATEPSAGWYWQFNHKQGFKHDGTTRTPNTAWITTISENSEWQPANDPCFLELGSNWRIPTLSEWTNVDANGNWTNWNGPWNSGLKMHAAGYLQYPGGALSSRGIEGDYWSSVQDITSSWALWMTNGSASLTSDFKTYGFPVRCVKELNPGLPVIITTTITNISTTTAAGGGTVTSDGGNSVTARGVCWSTASNPTTANSHTTDGAGTGMFVSNLTGLIQGTLYHVRAYATNSVGTAYGNEISFSTNTSCGSLTINHLASGGVAPVDKTVTYGTVMNLPGEPYKCWITSNLGATHSATSPEDPSEPSAGWYWQFNRKQGYKHDGYVRTPSTPWEYPIIENLNWQPANDPCIHELGSGWRIPTYCELNNIDMAGNWNNWDDAYNSPLKLHGAGFVCFDAIWNRGDGGFIMCNRQFIDSYGYELCVYPGGSGMVDNYKAYAMSIRCVRDTCTIYNVVSVHITASANPVCSGTSVTFNAYPTNGGCDPQYQWKVNGINVGTNSSFYTYTPINNDQVQCVLTSDINCPSNPATSNTITMAVNSVLPVSVMISASANPACAGTPVTFTAAAVNGGTPPSYQWKVNGINAGMNSLIFTYIPANNDQVKCILTSNLSCANGSPATSNTIVIMVNPLMPVSVFISASANPVCGGSYITFTATPVNGGTAPSYQWKVNSNNIGGNSSTFTYLPGNNDQVSCILNSNVSCTSGNPATSNTITMTVNPLITVSVAISASANPVCAGTSVIYSATPTNGGSTPTYQWKVNGINAGTNSASFTYTPANNDQVICILTSNIACATGNPAISNTITMTVNPLMPVSVAISASVNPVCAGTSVTFTATPANGGSTPSYQWKVNGINTGTNSSSMTYTPANNDQVICMLTSNITCPTGNPATSNTITMTVNPLMPVSVAISASVNPVCAGTSVTFTAISTNEGSSPSYQWLVNGTNAGTNSPSFAYTPANNDMVNCILTSSITCPTGNPATSNIINMTVNPLRSRYLQIRCVMERPLHSLQHL